MLHFTPIYALLPLFLYRKIAKKQLKFSIITIKICNKTPLKKSQNKLKYANLTLINYKKIKNCKKNKQFPA